MCGIKRFRTKLRTKTSTGFGVQDVSDSSNTPLVAFELIARLRFVEIQRLLPIGL
jgi:hypothetical protein